MSQQRLLAQVVADQVGHVGVDQLVVGDPVADRVGDRHVPGPGRVDDAGAADHRVGAELQRVEEVVVDPAVDDVHRAQSLRGVHVHPVAGADQVARPRPAPRPSAGPAGRARSRRRCATPGVSTTTNGSATPARRGRAQRGEQLGRVLVDRVDPLLGEQRREGPGHRQPVLDDVADPGRDPDVVLQHPELARPRPGSGRCRPHGRGPRSAARARLPRGGSRCDVQTSRQGTTPSSKAWRGP